MAALTASVMALAVQDRVIRLEMRLRMRELLPPDLQARIPLITREQCVALRFASDAELPGLVRKIVAGELTSKADIKKQIAHWQPDYLRAWRDEGRLNAAPTSVHCALVRVGRLQPAHVVVRADRLG